MTGAERRRLIFDAIKEAGEPLSGSRLAERFHVSRQVIVQDIALLRAEDCDIFSTSKGYILQKSPRVQKVFTVIHTDRQIEEELTAVVDRAGRVLDVFVDHEVYGTLRAELNIRSRKDVEKFVEEIKTGKSSPLKNLTSGLHSHTVETDTKEDMACIEQVLREMNFLS